MIPHKKLKIYTWQDIMQATQSLADQIATEGIPELIVGIPRGGMVIATILAELMNRDLLALYVSRRENGCEVREDPVVKCAIPAELIHGKSVLLVDEITVTGRTMETARMLLEELGATELRTCVLVDRSRGAYACRYYYASTRDDCNIFPWDYLVLCKNGGYCVHPEYLAMDESLKSNLYESPSESGPQELPQETLKGLSALFLAALKEQFGSLLLGAYLYGSALGEDYTTRSDIDFVVLLRELPTDAEERVSALHSNLVKVHPSARALEGGYHVAANGSAAGRRIGLWVDENGGVERCELEIEPDSTLSIIDEGLILYGPPFWRWIPRPEREELRRFSEQYLLEFEERLPERLNSAGHFFSSVLNACRSICYFTDGFFPTKTAAARRTEELIPEGKPLLEKALNYRSGAGSGDYNESDLHTCLALIEQARKIIAQRGML